MSEKRYCVPLLDDSWKRYFAPDDSSYLLERMGQGRIRRLWRWFESEEGLSGGITLAQNAPVFDLLLDRLCEELRAADPESEGDPLSPPALLSGPDWAHALFGTGLMFGCRWRNHFGQGPFERAQDLDELVRYISQVDWVAEVKKERDAGTGQDYQPLAVTSALLRREPLLALPIDALRKLVAGQTSWVQWCHEIPAEARALFFLGGAASGIEIPGLEDGELSTRQQAEVSSDP
ncbi:MAG TPA: hypothetical protein EYQ08_07015 [Planctomycetes bacterium]|nr:hypothetical protein [Planctomycetota bacterium]HIK81625.1 hypothetical protein [Planctomycetota bacterium]